MATIISMGNRFDPLRQYHAARMANKAKKNSHSRSGRRVSTIDTSNADPGIKKINISSLLSEMKSIQLECRGVSKLNKSNSGNDKAYFYEISCKELTKNDTEYYAEITPTECTVIEPEQQDPLNDLSSQLAQVSVNFEFEVATDEDIRTLPVSNVKPIIEEVE